MCRALIYLGRPIPLDNLLFRPESSLVNQALLPRKPVQQTKAPGIASLTPGYACWQKQPSDINAAGVVKR